MRKDLYVVKFESANYCGAPETCMAWATDEDDAMDVAHDYAENFFYEQDQEQYLDENYGDDEGVLYANVISAGLLKGSEYEQWARDHIGMVPAVGGCGKAYHDESGNVQDCTSVEPCRACLTTK